VIQSYAGGRTLIIPAFFRWKGRESGNSLRRGDPGMPYEKPFARFDQYFKGESPIMKNQLKNFLKDESGQDVAEYALLLVLVGIAIAVASPSITASILSVFSRTKSVLGV